jgi:hypothetical protein
LPKVYNLKISKSFNVENKVWTNREMFERQLDGIYGFNIYLFHWLMNNTHPLFLDKISSTSLPLPRYERIVNKANEADCFFFPVLKEDIWPNRTYYKLLNDELEIQNENKNLVLDKILLAMGWPFTMESAFFRDSRYVFDIRWMRADADVPPNSRVIIVPQTISPDVSTDGIINMNKGWSKTRKYSLFLAAREPNGQTEKRKYRTRGKSLSYHIHTYLFTFFF